MGKLKEIMQTAPCRFCGQMVQFKGDGDLTEPQAQEIATMNCSCYDAVDYRKGKKTERECVKKCLKAVWRRCPAR